MVLLAYPPLLALKSVENVPVQTLMREEGNMSNHRQNLNQVPDMVVDLRFVHKKGQDSVEASRDIQEEVRCIHTTEVHTDKGINLLGAVGLRRKW